MAAATPPGRPNDRDPPAWARRGTDRTGELPLDLREARLPWLEAEESDELQRGGSGRLLALGCGLLGLLALAGGGGWYIYHRHAGATMVATGGLIRAPEGPWKIRPANPGGDIAAGTGDTRFLVAEGKTRSVQVAGPGAVPVADASGGAGVPGIGVQIGAYATGAEAEAAWPALGTRFAVLSGLHHRVVEQQADLGSVFALQAVTEDAHAAQALCHELKTGGLSCLVRN